MTTITTPSSLALVPSLETAWQDVDSSFERFCLTAGIGAIEQMLCEDARQLAGARHSRGGGRIGYRWGRTKGKIGFHGGKVAVHRPRVRSYDGHEVALPTWTAAQAEDWLGRWAMNLMLINVSTRKLRRAVRLPEGDLPVLKIPRHDHQGLTIVRFESGQQLEDRAVLADRGKRRSQGVEHAGGIFGSWSAVFVHFA